MLSLARQIGARTNSSRNSSLNRGQSARGRIALSALCSANISDGRLSVVRVSEDIDEPGDHTRGLLALEGASGLENATGLGSLASLHTLYKSGLRILGPTHFFDTCVGGSLSGVEKGGLSEFGFEVVATMKFLSMIVDVAHASVRVIADLASLPAESRTYVMFLDCPPNASLQSPVLEFLYQF
jgi:microsomal dipeptidase-like Zn-dependent dipeptidase